MAACGPLEMISAGETLVFLSTSFLLECFLHVSCADELLTYISLLFYSCVETIVYRLVYIISLLSLNVTCDKYLPSSFANRVQPWELHPYDCLDVE